MPRKQQGWITFQSSEEERQILEQYSQQSQRTKTEVLRELIRSLKQNTSSLLPSQQRQENLGDDFSQKPELRAMKLSARNQLKGIVKRVVRGTVNAEVTLEIAPEVELIAIITTASAAKLGVCEGKQVYAVIKSNNVMIAGDV